MKKLVLKSGREKAIKNFHHWIFSGAIQSITDYENGEILEVQSSRGEILGQAYCNHHTSITGRMLSFGQVEAVEELKKNIDSALTMRKVFFDNKKTNCYRLINSEGDRIPGLIVDKYAEVLVLQSATAGIDKLKSVIVDYLVKKLKPKAIYEKSDVPSRREEGLIMQTGILFGKEINNVEVVENGIKFSVDLINSQKTGFFLDQREMRELVGQLSLNKKVLNCFSYTGGFSLYAAQAGAKQVDSVDISAEAVEQSKVNFEMNDLSTTSKKFGFFVKDVFEFLRENSLDYDLIILDPPAFAKKKNDVIKACRGYKDINRLALQKISAGGILVTSSCSYHVDEKLFQTVVFQAAAEARREVQIISRHRLAKDHPLNIFHPEGEYLKSLVLYVK